jgi:hypothetical protein
VGRIEGFAVRATGTRASEYELKYQGHCANLGDTAIIASPNFCGTRFAALFHRRGLICWAYFTTLVGWMMRFSGESRALEAFRVWFKKIEPTPTPP